MSQRFSQACDTFFSVGAGLRPFRHLATPELIVRREVREPFGYSIFFGPDLLVDGRRLFCGMSSRWLQFLRGAFDSEPALHPLDHGMAKKYIKQRLGVVYPALRNDPVALEKAYRALNLEPRAGIGKDEAPTVFEVTLPEAVD